MKTHEVVAKQFVKHTVSYASTGMFGKISLDYIADKQSVRPFYNRFPKLESFEDQIHEKANSYSGREVLVSVLQRQYAAARLKSPSIELLKSDNSFTITTGHQVCLFTGPLYFFYKIISAINTCKQLKERYPKYNFIPVYWMATEDHDFEEANHFFLPSGKIEWESGQGGALGRMKTVAMDEILEELKQKLGIGYTSGEILDLFKNAYVKNKDISHATRHLVHTLFGKHGVVVVEADDRELKELAVPYFKDELLNFTAQRAMAQTNKDLSEAGYGLQVQPHAINLFYLDDELRERIEKDDEGMYRVVRTQKSFTETEILDDLNKNPEKYSPNVILRPLYQEIILPNLAYIGGGGELAYWFQLKEVFKSFKIPFPVLMLRNSVMIVPEDVKKLMEKLDLKIHNVFENQHDLEDRLVTAHAAESLSLQEESEKLEKLFAEIENKLLKIDPQLERSVKSSHVRGEKIFESLEKKMMRAERRKQNVLINQLQKMRDYLMPRNGLQERNLNFTPLYLEYGSGFVDDLVNLIEPFDFEFTILEIESV